MKKLFFLFLLALCCLLIISANAATRYICGDYEYIVLSDGTAEITDYRGSDYDVVVPDNLDGFPVTSIGNYSLASSFTTETVTFPEGVTRLGSNVLNNCNALDEVILPQSLTSIGPGAFCDCSSLESITIPRGVTSIGGSAFNGCKSLTRIDIPESVTVINDNTFASCRNLLWITIPDSVVEISEIAFWDSYKKMVAIVSPGSYAEQFCKDHYECRYVYPGVSTNEEESVEGTWKIIYQWESDVRDEGSFMTFDADGHCSFVMDGQENAASYSINGDEITLVDGDDAITLSFAINKDLMTMYQGSNIAFALQR